MPPDQAARTLQDTAALWSTGTVSPQAVVRCACDALIAGLDSPSLRILAGLTRIEADDHAPGVLPAALAGPGPDFCPRDSRGGQEAAAAALAAQAVTGSLTPRELAAAIHRHCGHGLPLAERPAALDDEYDLGAYATMTPEQIDREVIEHRSAGSGRFFAARGEASSCCCGPAWPACYARPSQQTIAR